MDRNLQLRYPRLIRALQESAEDADSSWAEQVVRSAKQGSPFAVALLQEAVRKKRAAVRGSLRDKENLSDVTNTPPTITIRTDVA